MFANYLIGLREGLEAALVIGVLAAHLVRTHQRHMLPALWAGVGVAVATSLGVGALLTWGPSTLTFEAQEAIGGGLSIIAVGLITWMIMWMASAARTLSTDLKNKMQHATQIGRTAVAVVALIAVGREGLETALFVWAGAQMAQSTTAPVAGAALGLLTAVILGWALYRGALRVNLTKFFTITGVFLVVVAAGVLAYGIHDLQEARFLPGLHNLAFDVSAFIPPSSWYGTLLKGIFNFSPATTWLEASVWTLYVIPVLLLFFHRIRPQTSSETPSDRVLTA